MIFGIGCDILHINRVEKLIDSFGKRFINRCFTEEEQEAAIGKKNQSFFYAKRFVAKEACVKAIGLGLKKGITWKDMCILNDNEGKPILKLDGKAHQYLKTKLEKDQKYKIDVSMSDDYPIAQAFVVISIF